jgi:Fur family peroxide stress response transcriptional regulator
MIEFKEIKDQLQAKGLKVTLQRAAILKCIHTLKNHPTAEKIHIELLRDYPAISLGTVYNTLKTFVDKGILKIVETESGTVRYDHLTEKHHHIYSEDSGKIEDYYDEELDKILKKHFRKKEIPNFNIKDIKLFIVGNNVK